MSHYEMAVLLSPDLSDKNVQKFAEEARKLLEKHGAIEIGDEKIERRSLAYPLKKKTEGFYIFTSFVGPATIPEAVRTELLHREDLLRLAFIRKSTRQVKAEKAKEVKAKQSAEAAKSQAESPEPESQNPAEPAKEGKNG